MTLWKKPTRNKTMPIRDYNCERCKKQYEYFHHGPNDQVPTCPHCGSKEAKKLPAKSDFILKGRGWYKDGYNK